MITRNTQILHKCRECGKERLVAKYGQHVTKEGYMLVRVYPDDKYYSMTMKSGYVKRSRLVMAKFMGRPLNREEQVHHKNGVKEDEL